MNLFYVLKTILKMFILLEFTGEHKLSNLNEFLHFFVEEAVGFTNNRIICNGSRYMLM